MFILKRSRHASKICLGRGELQNLIVSFDFSVRLSLSCSVVGFVGSVSVSSCVLVCVPVCVLVVCKFKFTCRDVNAASAGAVSRGFSMPFAWDMLRWIRLASLVASFRNSFWIVSCLCCLPVSCLRIVERECSAVQAWYKYSYVSINTVRTTCRGGFVYLPRALMCALRIAHWIAHWSFWRELGK